MFEDLLPFLSLEFRTTVDVAPRVVEIMARLGIDATNGPDHLRGEQNILRWNDLQEQVDARLMIDTRIKKHVVQQQLVQRRIFCSPR